MNKFLEESIESINNSIQSIDNSSSQFDEESISGRKLMRNKRTQSSFHIKENMNIHV